MAAEQFRKELAIPWLRIVTEGAAIIISILLAFAIQAWWERVAERKLELESLYGLEEEFQTNIKLLATINESLTQQAALVLEVMSFIGPGDTPENDESAINVLARLLASNSDIFLAEATLATLISTKGLGIISNSVLREQLISWPVQTSRVEDSRQNIIDRMRQDLMPYLWTKVPVRSLDAISSPQLVSSPSRFELSFSELATDREFENILNELFWITSQARVRIIESQDQAELILSLIQSELAE